MSTTEHLHAETDGPRNATGTVLFVHGLGDDLRTWDAQRDHLAASRLRRVFYDHASHGRSGARAQHPVKIADLAADLAVMVESQPATPIVLVGHSMGSLTISALASQRPDLFQERIRGVLLAGSPGTGRGVIMGFPAAWSPVTRRVVPATLTALASLRSNTILGRLFFVTMARLAYGPSTRQQRRTLAEKVSENSPRAMVDHLRACLEFDEPSSYPVMAGVPTHVVIGTRDRLVAPDGGRQLARQITGARLVELHHRGHMMHIEDPVGFNAVLDDLVGLLADPAHTLDAG